MYSISMLVTWGVKEASRTNVRVNTIYIYILTKRFSPQDEILLVFSEGLQFCGNWSNLADINIEAK